MGQTLSSSSKWSLAVRAAAAVVATAAGYRFARLQRRRGRGLRSDLVLAIDFGTEGVRVALVNANDGTTVQSSAASYPTLTPASGWAEQRPADWWNALTTSCRAVFARVPGLQNRVRGVSLVATTCTLVPLENGRPLCNAMLWSDVRSTAQAARVHACRDEAVCRYTPLGCSAEWLLPKAMWLREKRPRIYSNADTIVELHDWACLKLTGQRIASANTATQRGFYNNNSSSSGWPIALFQRMGVPELKDKLPSRVLQVGSNIGGLTAAAAAAMGAPLAKDCPVFCGGGDAFVGLLGMGVCRDGEFGLMTGSSNVLSGFVRATDTTSQPSSSPASLFRSRGGFGPYPNAVLPGLCLVETGQPATGSMLRWFQRLTLGDATLKEMDSKAEMVPVGSDGVSVLDFFQGIRTPHVDSSARGAILGLSLATSSAHLHRAAMEAIAFGTRQSLETVQAALGSHNSAALDAKMESDLTSRVPLRVVGGAAKSDFFMQLYADVLGRPVVSLASTDAALLSAAVVAAAGVWGADLGTISRAFTRTSKTYHPRPAVHEAYSQHYRRYLASYQALKPLVRR